MNTNRSSSEEVKQEYDFPSTRVITIRTEQGILSSSKEHYSNEHTEEEELF